MVDELLRTLFHSFGGASARKTIEAFCDRAAAEHELLESLFEVLEHPGQLPPDPDAKNKNGRAVWEDQEDLLQRLARLAPEAFSAQVRARPTLRDSFATLSAVARVPGQETAGWLREALSGKRGSLRWLALSALLERHDPTVPALLSKLLRDRDDLVRFTAAQALGRLGNPDDLEALSGYLSEATIGGREAALDAIEQICTTHGLPLPQVHPGARLTIIEQGLPGLAANGGQPTEDDAGWTLDVSTATQVREGELLASGPGLELRSPCDGVVSWIDLQGSRLQIAIRRVPLKTRAQ